MNGGKEGRVVLRTRRNAVWGKVATCNGRNTEYSYNTPYSNLSLVSRTMRLSARVFDERFVRLGKQVMGQRPTDGHDRSWRKLLTVETQCLCNLQH